jgi:L-lactate dehydrogenase complex protein LldF
MYNVKVNFQKNSVDALKNQSLQNALKRAIDHFMNVRRKAVREFDDWEHLRLKARRIKENTIEHLDYYLEMLEANIIKAGGVVHWAEDAKVACEIILDLAKKHNVKSIVKSKSMATEEIELNHSIETEGIKVIETDLGEYIIQLAEERPSHIIAPAIHKTREDISKLFMEKLNTPYYNEPEQLTKIAREKLRGEFFNADMGISGVNFAVAETGTIVIVENEGNARLTTTLPRIHVALMGIEKVVPLFEDLPIFLNVLIRSATGQKMSTYVSFITGGKKDNDIDGPDEFHLVIMDNGRSKILSNEETRESLYCIRCGACLYMCPVYRKVGGHSYGWVYPGPIGAIITPQLLGIEKAPELPFASSLCGACKDVCPVKIDIPRVLLELRSKVITNRRVGAGLFLSLAVRLWRITMEHEKTYSFVVQLVYFFQKLWIRRGKITSLPFPFSRWTQQRDFPIVAKTPFRKQWKDIKNLEN